MKVYRLAYTITPPGEGENDTDKFIAEVPLLPGCRAWGATPAEALQFLHGVARAFFEIHRDRGWPLPEGAEALVVDTASEEAHQLLVAV